MPNPDLNRSNDSGTGAKALDRDHADRRGSPDGQTARKGGDERPVDPQAIGGDREPTVDVKAELNADKPARAKVNGSNVSD